MIFNCGINAHNLFQDETSSLFIKKSGASRFFVYLCRVIMIKIKINL